MPDSEPPSEEEEDDEANDAELARMEALAKKKAETPGGREGVAAERWEADADWKPPVHPKTPEQREKIKAACTKSFMCHLPLYEV